MGVQTKTPSVTFEPRILLIGDDTTLREEVSGHLEAGVGAPIFDKLSSVDDLDGEPVERSYDLCVLLYGGTPHGLDALDRLRRRCPTCPLILILDQAVEEVAEVALYHGADRYVIRTPKYGVRLKALAGALLRPVVGRSEQGATWPDARRYQTLLDRSEKGVLVRVGEKPVYANSTLARMLGYESSDEIRALDSIMDIVDERDRHRINTMMTRRDAGLSVPQAYEIRARRRDGSLVWLEFQITPVNWRDRPAIQSIVTDVSERRRVRAALKLAATVADRASRKPDFESATRVILSWLGRGMGWQVAESWLPADDGTLTPGPQWCRDRRRYQRFVEGSRKRHFGPGEGLPGRIWQSGRAEWVSDVANAPGVFARSILANDCGLKAACGVPIIANGRTIAVLCFFLSEALSESESLMTALAAGTSPLGPVLMHFQAEQARQTSVRQLETLIHSNADGILVVDEQDNSIVFTNPAAESAFGRDSTRMVGLPFGVPTISQESAELSITNARTGETRITEMRVQSITWQARPARLVSLRDVTERIEARAALLERVKELRCLYRVSERLEFPHADWKQTLQDIADDIPSGWQYPKETCARLRLGEIEVCSEGFREAEWRLTRDITVDDEQVGQLDVCYTEERPYQDREPFLSEEQSLVDEIARRIGQAMSTRRYQQALDLSRRRFQDFAEAASDWLWETDENMRFTYLTGRIEEVLGHPPEYWLGQVRWARAADEEDEGPAWR